MHFAECFPNIVNAETRGCNEARIIFDRNDPKSLKTNIRANPTAGLSFARYKVFDSTKIWHLQTKEFLSAIETKIELTEYLSKKLEKALPLDFVVLYSYCSLTSIPSINWKLCDCIQEEADTGIVLHALDVSKNNSFIELVIACSNTYVLLILLSYFKDSKDVFCYLIIYQIYIINELIK